MGRDARPLPRARRLDAPRRRRARLPRRDRASSAATSRSRSAARSRRGCAARDAVAVVFFGDGAVQAGHLRRVGQPRGALAAAARSSSARTTASPSSRRARRTRSSSACRDVVAPYGLERETVDGNDVLAVREAFGRFLAAARTGGGPFLLECLTHRAARALRGRPAALPRRRSPSAEWQRARPDPPAAAARRSREGWLDERGAGAARGRGRATRSSAAVRFARESPFPTAVADRGAGLRG